MLVDADEALLDCFEESSNKDTTFTHLIPISAYLGDTN